MNVRPLVSLVSPLGLLLGAAILTSPMPAADLDLSQFKRIEPQYIAALVEPGATRGNGAQSWGLWTLDPGPRGVELHQYDRLKASGGLTPAQWKLDAADWWLEEHGLLMEQPAFPLPPGKYLVTGGRKVTSVLTVYPKDKNGHQRWELANGASIYDVTHLGCRAGRYTPASPDKACSPSSVRAAGFPVNPGVPMPDVKGCRKQDYAVLIVVGLPAAR